MRTIQLKKIAIENFKAIKELTIEFGPVTNICGQNGIGKTSIYDAFCWVMFDKMSDGSQADKIRPHDADGKDVDFIDIRVEVTLLVDERYRDKNGQSQEAQKKKDLMEISTSGQ